MQYNSCGPENHPLILRDEANSLLELLAKQESGGTNVQDDSLKYGTNKMIPKGDYSSHLVNIQR